MAAGDDAGFLATTRPGESEGSRAKWDHFLSFHSHTHGLASV